MMNRKYTTKELEQLHAELYDILGETIRVCQKYHISYFIIGGTAIGALYDLAILPWDDDIDIGMTRENYNRFLEVAPGELGDSYCLSWIGTDPHSPYYFAKVKKNNTLFVEELFKNVPMHPGIFVDIFPFDRIPDNKLLRTIQHEAVKFLNCCLMGKEAWIWKHFGKCEIEHPTNRGAFPCFLNKLIDLLFSKKVIYRILVYAQSCFNSWNTRYYNNVMTITDHVTEESIRHLQPVKFGPLTVTAPHGLEVFLRYNYPTLHRFTKEEQEKVNNHYPATLSFSRTSEQKSTACSPIAMFVYNRVRNTETTIEYLKRNALAAETVLYIFSDGGKDERSWQEVNAVRRFLHTITGFKEVIIVERPVNFYLERNVIEGLSQVLSKHETVILLEDDICTSPIFLTYMNEVLAKYRDEKRVMHVAGFTNLDIPEYGDTYFTPHMSGAGAWATWKDRWQHFTHYSSREEALAGLNDEMINKMEYSGVFPCLKSLDRNPIPWDICWEIAIHRRDGLCLTPTHTLIRNIGLGKGTHFNTFRLLGWFEFDRSFRGERIVLKDIPIEENPTIEALYAEALKDHGMRYNLIGRIVRYLYKKVLPVLYSTRAK